jgi:Putative zincin peptidase
MADINALTEIRGTLRRGFHQVAHYKLSDSPSRGIPFLAIFMFLLGASVLILLALTIGKFDPNSSQVGYGIGIWEAGGGLAAILATIVLHEVVLGHAMRLFGAQPKYGMLRTNLVLYATASGYAFHRNAWIRVEIAALVMLSVVTILRMYILQGTIRVLQLIFCATVIASGAAVDLWMDSKIFRYSKAAYIIDEIDAFKVLTVP